MILYPAIDLRNGACVRLMHGRFDAVTEYDTVPVRRLTAFAAEGATWVHIVDLDGAEAGRPMQHDLIGEMTGAVDIRVQCGGGVRTADHVAQLLDSGVKRVVVGSLAVTDPDTVLGWLERFGPDSITLAIDVRAEDDRYIPSLKGWTEAATQDLWAVLERYPEGAVRNMLVTDVGRDGALTGPNLDLLAEVHQRRPDLWLQASGGIAGLEDIVAARSVGVAGAIIGRALYEKRFTLPQALETARA